MRRRPPSSPLLPYTTLFRSRADVRGHHRADHELHRARRRGAEVCRRGARQARDRAPAQGRRDRRRARGRGSSEAPPRPDLGSREGADGMTTLAWVLLVIAGWFGVAAIVAFWVGRVATRSRDFEVEATVDVAMKHLDEDYRRLCERAAR